MYLARDIPPFVMYCFNGKSCSSLLIESTNSMTCNCLHYFSHTVPANEVSVNVITPQPSCISEYLSLVCNVSNSSAKFIQWSITELGNITFFTNLHNVGNETTLFGRIIATLTETSGELKSILTIVPPLNDVLGNDVNNTIINCTGGVDSTELNEISGAQIKVYGKELKIYFIPFFHRHFENIVDLKYLQKHFPSI